MKTKIGSASYFGDKIFFFLFYFILLWFFCLQLWTPIILACSICHFSLGKIASRCKGRCSVLSSVLPSQTSFLVALNRWLWVLDCCHYMTFENPVEGGGLY